MKLQSALGRQNVSAGYGRDVMIGCQELAQWAYTYYC